MANFLTQRFGTDFAFSFSHGFVAVSVKGSGNAIICTGLSSVRFSQPVNRGVVHGTGRGPIKFSAGQVQKGSGALKFSMLEESTTFWDALGFDPLFTFFNIDYALVKEDGQICSYQLEDCLCTDYNVDHSNGPDALEAEVPFEFLRMKKDRSNTFLSGLDLIRAISNGIGAVNNLI